MSAETNTAGTMRETELGLGVYRLLDDRLLPPGPAADALERQRHVQRRRALEDLDGADEISVSDWGDTKDEQPHEFVELVVAVAGAAWDAAVPGLAWLAKTLVDHAVEETVSAAIGLLVAKLRPAQKEHAILDVIIKHKAGGVQVAVDPPDRNGTITVSFADGSVSQVTYNAPVAPEPVTPPAPTC